MLIPKKSKKLKPIQIVSKELLSDIENISDSIEEQIGIRISKMDIIRLLIKTYHRSKGNG